MVRLLKIEAAKVLYYRAFWTVIGISLSAFLGAGKATNITINGSHLGHGFAAIFWASGFVCQIFLGYLFILLICNEFENRTLRQHIIDGLGRGEYLLSLFIMQLIFVLASVVVVVVVGTATGHIENFSSLSGSDALITIGEYILRSLGYFSLALVISLFAKKSGFAVALFLAWSFFLEPVVGWVAGKYVSGLDDMLPTAVFSHLLRSPLSGLQNAADGGGVTFTLIAVGYTALFWVVGSVKLSRMDV